MQYELNDIEETMQAFMKSRMDAASCVMDVAGGVNESNPLELLRIYEIQPPTIDSLTQLASLFLNHKEVKFIVDGEERFRFTYDGKDFGECFMEHPEFLDPCLKNCYNILLKKLTAPSTSSMTAEIK